MAASVNSFSGEVIAGRWDLLRLTPYTANDLLAVKHSAARLQVWRMTMVVVDVRLNVIILFLLTYALNNLLDGYAFEIGQILTYLPYLPLLIAYIVEPIWRAQLVTLLGLTISIRLRHTVSLMLTAIGTILTLWIAQPLILGGIFYASVRIFNQMFYPLRFNDPLMLDLALFLASLYIAAVFYAFYVVLYRAIYPRLLYWIDHTEA
jgi:hypothetical protein